MPPGCRNRNRDVQNVSISYCFSCNEMCLWVYDQLVWPRRAGGSEPKHLAPPNVRREYDETSQTLEASPRGAAALLRLAIEKLCKELGVTGESLKDDIAFFVRKTSMRACRRSWTQRGLSRATLCAQAKSALGTIEQPPKP